MCPHFLPVTVLLEGAPLDSAVSLTATSRCCPFCLLGLSGLPLSLATATERLGAQTFHRIIAVAFGPFSCQFPEEFAQTQTDYVISQLKQSVLFTARRIKSKPLSAAPPLPSPPSSAFSRSLSAPPALPPVLGVLCSGQAELLAVPRWVPAAARTALCLEGRVPEWSAGLQTIWLLTRTR